MEIAVKVFIFASAVRYRLRHDTVDFNRKKKTWWVLGSLYKETVFAI